MESKRIENDALGSREIPGEVYWGIHTLRARENFPFSGQRVSVHLIRALAQVKCACAAANAEVGDLPKDVAEAIIKACGEVAQGQWADEFPLPALQGGAGTSTNMNMNEVLANRALEILGLCRGDYVRIDPLRHVNMHQSTNDVYPTAVRVAAIALLRELSGAVAALQGSLQRREKDFAGIVTVGRSEWQDAVPMTLGGQFSAMAESVGRDRWRVAKCEERLRVVNLGGTAVGTGLGAPRDYIYLVIERLRELTGMGLSRGENPAGETANADSLVEVMGILKALAADLIKISGDLRFLNHTGEIRLPALQAGSSLMPGKVNPVVPEVVIQGCFKVLSEDWLVAWSAAHATQQIVEFMPLLAESLLGALVRLEEMCRVLARHVDELYADEIRCRTLFDANRALVTAFVSDLGYARMQELIAEFDASARSDVRAFLEERLSKSYVDRMLAPQRLMALGYRREHAAEA